MATKTPVSLAIGEHGPLKLVIDGLVDTDTKEVSGLKVRLYDPHRSVLYDSFEYDITELLTNAGVTGLLSRTLQDGLK